MEPDTTTSPSRNSPPLPPVAGVKRRAVSLLPAFDPVSSSPGLPRPLKRTRDAFEGNLDYPTPVPTSSTAILTSSPPQRYVRPPLNRPISAFSERAPLSDLRSLELPEDGKPIKMGRSSASCSYQLSSNRLISRVHVEAAYEAGGSSLRRDRMKIRCTGWNGAKIHSLGKAHTLKKGDVFESEDRNADIMVDVHNARVMLTWPPKKGGAESAGSSSVWGDESSPTKGASPVRRTFAASPIRYRPRIPSPVSPSPAVQAALAPSSPFQIPLASSPPPVVIYEDEQSPDDDIPAMTLSTTQQSTQILSQSQLNSHSALHAQSQSSEAQKSHSLESSLSEPQEDFSDHDEENDPIIHSFGPYGANILSNMASFKTHESPHAPAPSPRSNAKPLKQSTSPSQLQSHSSLSDVRSHIINQLAFSRLSSTPLSVIISHLPKSDAAALKQGEIRDLILDTQCIGEVTREGKDAAGKRLESEFYYIPENDEDQNRKEAVVNDLGRTGLRNCRKQHKQYFWRKPK